MITLILVAQRAGARWYQHRGPHTGLTLIRETEHEAGRLRDGSMNTDRDGRAFDRHGNGRHAMEPQESPHERIAANFARELAHELDEARIRGEYDQLILVSEPRMLGLLRDSISSSTAKLVCGSVDRDYSPMQQPELAARLEHLIFL